MTTRLLFEIIGHPEPAGSKRAVSTPAGVRVIDANRKAGSWKTQVAQDAQAAMLIAYGPGAALFEGPLGLSLIFTLRRPRGHFGTGRNEGKIKPGAPPYPCVKPDATKLLRGVEDALTGVVWRDDAQVVEQIVTKRYGDTEGVRVTVWTP